MEALSTKVQVHELSLTITEGPDSVLLRCEGSADTRTSKKLEEALRTFHERVLERGLGKAVVDFRNLEFMNSSCFKAFVSWLSRVQGLDQASRFTIEFNSNPAFHWQSRSLQALSCFASDLVQIKT